MNRKMELYENLFEQYERLDFDQESLYKKGEIFLPVDKKQEYQELQIKKISILNEMEQCLC